MVSDKVVSGFVVAAAAAGAAFVDGVVEGVVAAAGLLLIALALAGHTTRRRLAPLAVAGLATALVISLRALLA